MVLNGIPISENQCIGDSLDTINNAFVALSANIPTLPPTLSAINSPTIDLSYNSSTGVLSANFIGSSLTTILSSSLSASPMVARAWVNFNANSSQIVSLNGNFNVTGVTAGSSGRYVVTVPFTVTNRPVSITVGFNTSSLYPLYGSITSRTTNSITLRCDTGVGGGGNYNDVTDINVIFY